MLQRMGYRIRKFQISLARFDELKEIFLADVAAEILIKEIPEPLITNWNQMGLSTVPTGDCTMESDCSNCP